jgi:hypothetical protein
MRIAVGISSRRTEKQMALAAEDDESESNTL